MGASAVFQLPTVFTNDDLPDMGYEESADVTILTSGNHPPQALRRYGDIDWTLGSAVFVSTTAAPTALTATAVVHTVGVPVLQKYAVTAIDDTTGRESLISNTATCNNDLGVDVDNHNTLAWTLVAGSSLYNVYAQQNGLWGFIGGSADGSFTDDNIAPDFTDGPPKNKNPFVEPVAQNYPRRVTLYEQRAIFASTYLKPNTVYGSQSGDFFNMNFSIPVQPSDAFTFGIAAREVNNINHVVPAKVLLIFTDSCLFSVRETSGPISPTSFQLVAEGYRGCSPFTRPQVVDDITFYNTLVGNQVRTIGYQFYVDGYRGNDLTVFAPHLFRNHSIVAWAWCACPTSTLYCVREDGRVCCLTWQAEQDVWGWSLMDTGAGFFEDVISVTENNENVPYFIVRRTIGGVTRRFVERLTTPVWGSNVADYVGLDASQTLVVDGAPVTVLTGLGYLEGETVNALVDGNVVSGLVVVGGSVTLPIPAKYKVTVGLPYESWAHTLPYYMNVPGLGSTAGRRAQLGQTILQVTQTRGIEVAPGKPLRARDADTSDASAAGPFYPVKIRSDEPYGAPGDLWTGLLEVDLAPGDWSEATAVIRQRQPLPWTLNGVYPDEVGGG